jgi:hypothetical protein
VGEGIVLAIAVPALALAMEVDAEEGTNGIEVCIVTTRIDICLEAFPALPFELRHVPNGHQPEIHRRLFWCFHWPKMPTLAPVFL